MSGCVGQELLNLESDEGSADVLAEFQQVYWLEERCKWWAEIQSGQGGVGCLLVARTRPSLYRCNREVGKVFAPYKEREESKAYGRRMY